MRQTRNLKYRIYGFEVRCAVIISDGFISGKGKQWILKQLRKELNKFSSSIKLSPEEIDYLWQACVSEYIFASRQVWGNRRNNEKVYLAIRKMLPDLEKVKNKIGRSAEARDKEKYISNISASGIFYICSQHSHCAKDHIESQGRVYVSEHWRERCNADEVDKIEAYIRNHRCKTIEYIVGPPVYMVTRPNCRHFFKEVSVSEVLGSSAKSLINRYGMKRNTISSDAYYMYRLYYERLRVLLNLRNTCPCNKLEKDIADTRKLIKKWLSIVDR